MPSIPGAGPLIIRGGERLARELGGDRNPGVKAGVEVLTGFVAGTVDPVGSAVELIRRGVSASSA